MWRLKERILSTVFWRINTTRAILGLRLWKAKATPFQSQLSATSSFVFRRSETSWRSSRPPRTPPAPRPSSKCCQGSALQLSTRITLTRALRRSTRSTTPTSCAPLSTLTTLSTASWPRQSLATLTQPRRENWGQASWTTGLCPCPLPQWSPPQITRLTRCPPGLCRPILSSVQNTTFVHPPATMPTSTLSPTWAARGTGAPWGTPSPRPPQAPAPCPPAPLTAYPHHPRSRIRKVFSWQISIN